MSRLALDWVKKNFSFHGKVDNLEKDFSDGQLFLQILRQRGVLTDEDAINESGTPFAAAENLKLFRLRVQPLNIRLEKANVANILSEQPGAAADVIMRLKAVFEVQDGLVKVKLNNLNAIRTNRPHEFKRESDVFRNKSSAEKTLLLADTHERDAKMSMLLSGYQVFKYTEDDKIKADEELEHSLKKEKIKEARFATLQKMSLVETKRRETEDEGRRKWKGNQKDKYNRSVRDVQFEMALQTKQELQMVKTNRQHALEQTNGIDFYEQNLRRNGFGGAGDDDAKLDVTYEDGEMFLDRLEDTARRSAPTDGEIGDFTMQLRNRTKELRIARQEKVRRKRRMIVSQLAAGSAAAAQEEEERLVAEEQRLANEAAMEAEALVVKMGAKQAKNEEIAARARAERNRIAQDAEEQLRIFSEQQIMLADDKDRAGQLTAVRLAQQERAVEKHIRNEKLMYSMVLDLVNEVLDLVESGEDISAPGERASPTRSLMGTVGRPAAELPELLCQFVRQLLDNPEENGLNKLSSSLSKGGRGAVGQKRQLQLHEVAAMDMWAPAVSILSNIGLWTNGSGKLEASPEYLPAETTSLESAVNVLRESNVEPESGNPEFPQPSVAVEDGLIQGNDIHASSRDSILVKIADRTCSDSYRLFVETLISRLAISKAGATSSATSGDTVRVDATPEEISYLDCPVFRENLSWDIKAPATAADAAVALIEPSGSRTILVMGLETDSARACQIWNMVASWFHNRVAIWDVVKAMEVAKELKQSASGDAAPSFSATVSALFGDGIRYKSEGGQEAALAGMELSAQAVKVVAEIGVFYTKIMNYSEFIVRSSPPMDFSQIPEAPFDNTTLAILLLQTLWLRAAVFKALETCPTVDSIDHKVIIGGLWRFGHAGFDSNFISRAVVWYMRGCTRADVPETETVLMTAAVKETEREKYIQLPPGTKPGKTAKVAPKAAAKKGQVVEVPYDKSPCVSAIIWNLASGGTPGAHFTAASEAVSPQQEVIDFYARPLVTDSAERQYSREDASAKDTWKMLSEVIISLDGLVPVYPLLHLNESAPAVDREGGGELPAGQTDGKGASDTAASFASFHLKCRTLVALSEVCAASVLDICGYRSSADPVVVTDTPTELSEESPEDREIRLKENVSRVITRVTGIVDVRRSRLHFLDRVWMNHVSGANVLKGTTLLDAVESLCESRVKEMEHLAPLIMGLLYKLQYIDHSFRVKASSLVHMMKLSDPRWQSICVKHFSKLNSKVGFNMSAEDWSDLKCGLGDVIDQRHFAWSIHADHLIQEATRESLAFVEYIIDLSELLARSSARQLSSLHASGKALADALQAAAYEDTPWAETQFLAPYSVKSRGGALRMTFDRRQDELRANASNINANGSIISEWKASEQERMWRDFASIDLPNASSSLQGSPDGLLMIPIVQDLHFEQFGKAICMQKTLLATSEMVGQMLEDLKHHFSETMHKKNTFEHTTLKMWLNDMQSAFAAEEKSKFYYFDSPSDSSLDGIEWISGVGCINLREMVLPLSVILDISKDVYEVLASGVDCKLSESPIINGRIGNDLVSDVLCSVLISAATLCVDRGVTLPDYWKQPSKIRLYSEGICASLPLINSAISLKDLIRFVLARQLYGFIPSIPSPAYLTAVVKSLGMDVPDSPAQMPMQALLYKLSCNPKVPAGWWESPQIPSDSSSSSLDKIKMRSLSRNASRGGSSTGSLSALNNGTLSSASMMSKSEHSTAAYSGSYGHAVGDISDLLAPKAGLWALESLAWTCIDSSTANVDLVQLLNTLSMYPQDMLKYSSIVSKSLISVANSNAAMDLNLMHPGLSRAAAVAAQVGVCDYFAEHGFCELSRRDKLSSLLGPMLTAAQFSKLLCAVKFANYAQTDASVESNNKHTAGNTIDPYNRFLYKEIENDDIEFCLDAHTPTFYQSFEVVESFAISENGQFNHFDL